MGRSERQPLNAPAPVGVLGSKGGMSSHKGLSGMGVATMVGKLNPGSVRGWLSSRRGWRRRSNKLIKNYRFGSFRDSIVFVNRIATLADSHDHHPDIEVRCSTVTVTLSTQEVGGISDKDLELAEQIDFATSK